MPARWFRPLPRRTPRGASIALTLGVTASLLGTGLPAAAASLRADPFPFPEWVVPGPATAAATTTPAATPAAPILTPVLRGRFVLHVPVLMYHRISAAPRDALLPGLWITPARFREQLVALQRAGWHTVTAADLARHLDAHRPLPDRTFVITLDDGARDGYTHAFPVLRDLGMVATFCVNPGRTGRPWTMSRPMLVELQAAGHEIAQHSLTHGDLPALSGSSLRHQLVPAQALLGDWLGAAPITLCYPFGHHDARVRAAVASMTGIRLAFTTAWGAREDTADRFRAPRVRVSPGDSGAELVRRLAAFR